MSKDNMLQMARSESRITFLLNLIVAAYYGELYIHNVLSVAT